VYRVSKGQDSYPKLPKLYYLNTLATSDMSPMIQSIDETDMKLMRNKVRAICCSPIVSAAKLQPSSTSSNASWIAYPWISLITPTWIVQNEGVLDKLDMLNISFPRSSVSDDLIGFECHMASITSHSLSRSDSVNQYWVRQASNHEQSTQRRLGSDYSKSYSHHG
jgi:hypothetical protein